jgi:hypothetical protein
MRLRWRLGGRPAPGEGTQTGHLAAMIAAIDFPKANPVIGYALRRHPMKTTIGLALLAFFAPLPAATIFSETSSSQGQLSGSSAFGFNLTSTWNNVAINWDIFSNNPPATVTAYLTTQIGPGTNATHNVVPSVVVNVNNAGVETFFSGLTLTPGNYYVSFTPSNGLTGPLGGGSSTDTLGSGVTSLGLFTLTGNAPDGTPGSQQGAFRFEVSGDLEAAGVPEPSTFGMIGLGLAFVAGACGRTRRQPKRL